jgi:tetratricopeptide (TPR) repeat protein
MPGVFLSYRRTDGDYAVLLYAWLAERFGAANVFWDREDIDPGRDFRRVLSERLREAQALVALIGPGWSPSEWIQREIGAAIRRKALVLPVLVGEVSHLNRESLPRAIRRLANLQSLETRDLRFRDRLIEALEQKLTGTRPADSIDDVRVQRLSTLLRNQSDHRQALALVLITQGRIDEASDVLDETFELLMTLLEFKPGNAEIQARLGFLYKDLAQVFEDSDPVRFQRHVQSGLQLFQSLVKRRLAGDIGASAWNGLGNMYLLQGEFEKAAESCLKATRMSPSYPNAWAELFLAYDGMARKGTIDIAAMRNALARLKTTSKGDPLLTGVLPQYESILRRWESGAKRRSKR